MEKKHPRSEKTKQQQQKIDLKVALFGILAFLLMIVSPTGLQIIGNFCKPHQQNKFFSHILQKSTDLLWMYGYYQETFQTYRYLYENTNENSNLILVQESLANMALTYYQMQEYRSAWILYLIFKKRWPNVDQTPFQQIANISISFINPIGLTVSPPEWVLDLADKYEVRY